MGYSASGGSKPVLAKPVAAKAEPTTKKPWER
jgi:hypothetical protein